MIILFEGNEKDIRYKYFFFSQHFCYFWIILDKNIYSVAAVLHSLPVLSTLWRVRDAVAELLSNFLGGSTLDLDQQDSTRSSTAEKRKRALQNVFKAQTWPLKKIFRQYSSRRVFVSVFWKLFYVFIIGLHGFQSKR